MDAFLEARLKKTESKTRWLTAIGLTTAVMAGISFWLSCWPLSRTRPARVSVEAKRFTLKDEEGRTRASLEVNRYGPSLQLLDSGGQTRAELAIQNVLGTADPVLALCTPNGERRVTLWLSSFGEGMAALDLSQPSTGRATAHLQAGGERSVLSLVDHAATRTSGVWLILKEEGLPHLEVDDANGFKTTIGGTELQNLATGATRQTSAASIVLFNKENRVIWSVP